MMTSHFRGSDSLLRKMTTLDFILLFLFLEILVKVTGEDQVTMNSIVELSSRDDLVHMAGYGEEKLSTVTIRGKILCHACVEIHGDEEIAQPLPAANPVTGATVAVFCGSSGKSKKSWARGTTDEYGGFLIDLPSHLHAIPNIEKVCHLKVLHLPKNSGCHPAFLGRHKGIKLLSIEDGARAYTTNAIHLTPKPSKKCKNMARNRKAMVHVY